MSRLTDAIEQLATILERRQAEDERQADELIETQKGLLAAQERVVSAREADVRRLEAWRQEQRAHMAQCEVRFRQRQESGDDDEPIRSH